MVGLLFPLAFYSIRIGDVVSFPPDLQGGIGRIHRTVELMYSDKSMMQVSGTSVQYVRQCFSNLLW